MKKLNTIMAVALAATFAGNVLANDVAGHVPGLPSGYSFTDQGLTVLKGGAGSITDMNSIISSFATTGGSALGGTDNNSEFWNAFIGDPGAPESFFDYAAAKPMIEELVYTVEGKSFREESGRIVTLTTQGTNSSDLYYYNDVTGKYSRNSELTGPEVTYAEIGSGAGSIVSAAFEAEGYYEANTADTDKWELITTVSGNTGFAVVGDLDIKGKASRDVLKDLGYFINDPTGTFGEEGSVDYASLYVTTARTDAQIKSDVLQNSVSIKANAITARIDGQAYSNAVNLLKLISDENILENVLNVDKATKALAALVDHHNSFLSASIRLQADKLKKIMQNNAYLTSASVLGQTARDSCEGQTGGNILAACSKIGTGFDTINDRVEVNGTGSISDNNAALLALSAFVTNLVDFDLTSGSYVAATAADNINTDFGTITVDKNIAQGSISDWSDALAVDFDGFDATFVFDYESTTGTAQFN